MASVGGVSGVPGDAPNYPYTPPAPLGGAFA